MKRRNLFKLLTGTLIAWPLFSLAQQAAKIPRIGLLASGGRRFTRANREAFQQGLHALGYVEGQNIAVEYRYAEGQHERAAELAAELVRLQVDVIVAAGSIAIRAAQRATSSIPIVMAGTADPVAAGFVASLARPGGNITGVSDLSVDLPTKRLALLREIIPRSTRIAVLVDPATIYYAARTQNLLAAAKSLGLSLQIIDLPRADDLPDTFAALVRSGIGALLVIEHGLLLAAGPSRQVVDLAMTYRLLTIFDRKRTIAAGGLMSYGPSIPESWRGTAVYVDKILKGATPADLPVAQATAFELVVNLKTAKALGLTLPPLILLQATEVIE